jgi:hypothetical protein
MIFSKPFHRFMFSVHIISLCMTSLVWFSLPEQSTRRLTCLRYLSFHICVDSWTLERSRAPSCLPFGNITGLNLWMNVDRTQKNGILAPNKRQCSYCDDTSKRKGMHPTDRQENEKEYSPWSNSTAAPHSAPSWAGIVTLLHFINQDNGDDIRRRARKLDKWVFRIELDSFWIRASVGLSIMAVGRVGALPVA